MSQSPLIDLLHAARCSVIELRHNADRFRLHASKNVAFHKYAAKCDRQAEQLEAAIREFSGSMEDEIRREAKSA